MADSSFVWTKSIPLVPDVEFESVLESAYQAAESAWDELSGSLEPASSSHRSRWPVSRSLDISSGSERVVAPPAPRPRIEGCPTPVPPSPRPKIEGRPTPTPPASRRSQSPGSQPSSSSAVSAVPAADIVVGPAEDIYQAEASSPAEPILIAEETPEPCILYRADDLTPVVTWCPRAIREGYRRVISLDQRKGVDRDIGQTIALVRAALACGIAVVVLSYIPDSSFDDHGSRAVRLWRTVLDNCTYRLTPLPIIVTSKPLGPLGKLSAIRYIWTRLCWDHSYSAFEWWCHVDDRQDIVAEVNSDRHQRAVCWRPKDRRSLLKLCQDERLL